MRSHVGLSAGFAVVVGISCSADPIAGELHPAPEFADATTYRCECTLLFDDQGGASDSVVVGQVCLASTTFCDVGPELAAGCESRTTRDECATPRCPDLSDRQEAPLTGAARREYVRWALKCAGVIQTTPVGSDACGERDVPCAGDDDCGGRLCVNGECTLCERGKQCSPVRCLRSGTNGGNENDFDGFCEISCTQDSDCPVDRGPCTDGSCGGCRDGSECEAERACTTGDGVRDANIDAGLETCPTTVLDNGCEVTVDLDLCRAAETTNDDQCFRACTALGYLTDFDLNGIDAFIFGYKCGGGDEGCAAFDGTCQPNTTATSEVVADLSGVAKECAFECPEDAEDIPPIGCLIDDDVDCTVDADCPVDEELVFLPCVDGKCEVRECPPGLVCERGVNTGELDDGTLVTGNLCTGLRRCSQVNLDECTQVRISPRPEASTRPDCHAGFESAPMCRVPTEDPLVHNFGGVLGELLTGQSAARLRNESFLHVVLGGQSANTPLRGSVDLIGEPCPGEPCNVSIRIIAQGDDVQVSSCALPPFDSCSTDDDCPAAGFQVPCVLGGCADFSGFCASDADCPVIETQVSCLPGVMLTDISLQAGTGTTPSIPIDETGRGDVPFGVMSGTFAINVAGSLMGATGPSLGSATRVEVDWENKRVEISDAFETGALSTELHIVADIQNYAPIAIVEHKHIELACMDASGTPVSLRGRPVDLDGPQDVLFHGWMRGSSSAHFVGEGLGLNVAAVDTVAPLGTTRFTYRVKDRAFREATATTLVTVTNAPPQAVITAPATTECSSFEGGVVHLSAAETVDPDGTPPADAVWHLGAVDGPVIASGVDVDVTLPLGEHDIVAVVNDPCGKTDVAEVTVTVVDTTPPAFEDFVFLGPSCLWPPHHKLAVIDLDRDFDAEIADLCDPSPRLEFVGASSDEPDNGLGDGDTANDVQLFAERICLRAERQGTGDGRSYALHLLATDASGNAFDPTVDVEVPRDQRETTRCREIAQEMVDDGDPRCSNEAGTSHGREEAVIAPDSFVHINHETRTLRPPSVDVPKGREVEGPAVGSSSCASVGRGNAPFGALMILLALAVAPARRRRRRFFVAAGFAAFAGVSLACPGVQQATALPPVVTTAAAGTIDGRAFSAQSFLAWPNAHGDLVISIADYSLTCTRTSPPDEALASLPRKLLLLIPAEKARAGVLHIQFPGVQDAQANVNLYDAENNARSVVVRRGEITIDAIDASNVRGSLSLLETSTDVSIAGSFDIALCPPD